MFRTISLYRSKTIVILLRPRNVRFSIGTRGSFLDSATTNPKAQRISAARIIIGVGETNVSFGPRFLGRAVSRQAIFPLSRVTQPRRHNSFLGAITTRRDETRRGAGPEEYTRCCARWQDLACNRPSVQSRAIHRSSGTADRFYGYAAIDRSAVRRYYMHAANPFLCSARRNCTLEFIGEMVRCLERYLVQWNTGAKYGSAECNLSRRNNISEWWCFWAMPLAHYSQVTFVYLGTLCV